MSRRSQYIATFSAGYLSGFTGELFAAAQNGRFTASGLTHPSFRDNCIISGTQQVAKDFVKETMKKNEKLARLSCTNPLAFGALTGLPMWALTRIVATPLENRHDSKKKPFTGFASSVLNDAAYYSVKNGLDEYCSARVFPVLLPKLGHFATQRFVEASIAGAVAGGAYVLSWPVKSALTGQTALTAFYACTKTIPKAAIKKATFTLAKPRFVALLK